MILESYNDLPAIYKDTLFNKSMAYIIPLPINLL